MLRMNLQNYYGEYFVIITGFRFSLYSLLGNLVGYILEEIRGRRAEIVVYHLILLKLFFFAFSVHFLMFLPQQYQPSFKN